MTKRQEKIVEYLACVLIIAVVLALLLPPAVSDREPVHRSNCRNNLRILGIALQNYHAAHGSFPPAYIADENGQPMHSWRALLLPFLDEQAIYDEYRFDEPWDGPNNSQLEDKVRRTLGQLLSCPRDWKDNKQSASYLAVVGAHGAWAGSRSCSQSHDFGDGLATTALLVEVHDTGIRWFEPRDMKMDDMCFGINDPSNCGIRSPHRWNTYVTYAVKSRFAHVLYADGAVGELPETTPPRTVRALLTRDGGEEVARP